MALFDYCCCDGGMGDSDFTIDIHHGGKFHDLGNGLEYLGGKVLEDMHYELDEWSLQEIVSELQKLGYKGNARIWYCEPGYQLSSGLRELMSDGDAMRMGRLLVSQTVKHCSVYVVDGCREGNGVEICSNDKDYVPTEAEYNESGFIEVEVECESEASSEEDRFDDSADDGDHEDHFGFDVEDGNDGGVGNAFGGFDGPLNEHNNAQTSGVDAAVNDAAVRDDVEVGEISEGYETEDIDSYEGDSDDMIKKRRYPKYNEAEMSREYVFKVGLEFKSLSQFKDAIKEHALLNGRDIRYIKSDKVRCRVGYRGKKGKCRWMAFASKVGGSDCFRLKTLNGKHTCGRDYSGRLASSSWVSQKISQRLIGRGERRGKKYMAGLFYNMASSEITRLDVIAMRAMEWQARWAGGLKYKVSHKNRMIVERFVVDLLAGTCSCRFWGLCGMPCPHACCAIFEKGDSPEDYCNNFYSPAAYIATYGNLVSPINGENMWPKVECDTIIPPIFRVKPGRPRMVRIREPDENRSQTKLRRTGSSVTCSNCGQYGHNRRHCPNPIVSGRGRAASSQPLPTTPASSQQLPATPAIAASTQPPPILATTVSQAPNTSTGAVAPTTATSQQALPLEGPASQPLLAVASAKFHQAPKASSQPLPKTKVFGVRRSGRLKLGVMKQKGAPSLHIDLSDD
ncbi:hypothetical protein Ahy_B06g083482 [Arachis hypogaea]|uniref:CCHC-type domain-containing protein n=1 Tax=Arachis hypogaea TaxID=3818 RepID=A0A444YPU7_ARAHY|nr:hypothetical protein Ahy_B06g083482 [Arachis hypogaea]